MTVLFGFLSGEEDLRDEWHRFDAKPSRHLGHTCHYDSIGDVWHDSLPRLLPIHNRVGEQQLKVGEKGS
jgi:hypothetical protein